MRGHYEDEFEVMMLHNPRGGKPKKIGSMLTSYSELQIKQNTVELSSVKEDNSIRFHLGYCPHGSNIIVGEKRGLLLIKALMRGMNLHTLEDIDAEMLRKLMRSKEQDERREEERELREPRRNEGEGREEIYRRR